MKMPIKLIALAALVAALPFFGNAAWAAEVRQPETAAVALNGVVAPAPAAVAANWSVKPETIVVAGRRGRYLGPAIIGGVVAGALIAGAARAHEREYYYGRRSHYRYRNRCDRWLWRCEDGSRRSCRKFYRYCD